VGQGERWRDEKGRRGGRKRRRWEEVRRREEFPEPY
jgi:hypothetical protein